VESNVGAWGGGAIPARPPPAPPPSAPPLPLAWWGGPTRLGELRTRARRAGAVWAFCGGAPPAAVCPPVQALCATTAGRAPCVWARACPTHPPTPTPASSSAPSPSPPPSAAPCTRALSASPQGLYFLSLFSLMWCLVFMGYGAGFKEEAYIPATVGAVGLAMIILGRVAVSIEVSRGGAGPRGPQPRLGCIL
jgi:hypothetical protein